MEILEERLWEELRTEFELHINFLEYILTQQRSAIGCFDTYKSLEKFGNSCYLMGLTSCAIVEGLIDNVTTSSKLFECHRKLLIEIFSIQDETIMNEYKDLLTKEGKLVDVFVDTYEEMVEKRVEAEKDFELKYDGFLKVNFPVVHELRKKAGDEHVKEKDAELIKDIHDRADKESWIRYQ